MWTKVSGPGDVQFDNPAAASTTVSFTLAGTYTLRLTANDGALSAFDEVDVLVRPDNQAPVAQDQQVTAIEDTSTPILLGGDDPDGDAVTFTLLTAPAHGTLTGSAPQLTYLPSPNYAGQDMFAFEVTDGQLTSNPATVTIQVQGVNDNPTAQIAASPLSGQVPLTVGFDGRGSSDPDGGIASYQWNFGDGTSTASTLSHQFTTPGTYVVTLMVADIQGATDTATVTITAADANQPPVVSAGSDRSVTLPSTAALDGTVTDPDLPVQPLSTTWSTVSGPGTVTFGNAAAVDTTAAFSVEGAYVLRLTAADGVVSVSDDVAVIVTAADAAFSATLEAETMPIKTTGGPVTGGWNIWSNGYVEGTVAFPADGEYTLQVMARGTPVASSWPLMEVRIDGQWVATIQVTTKDWAPYAVRSSISAGSRRIAVAFTNDAYAPPEDRNLYVDKVNVESFPMPPPLTLEAERMLVKTTGGPVTGGWNIWSNGYVEDSLQFPVTGMYKFDIVARGVYAGLQWSIMELRIDGKMVKTFTVDSTGWKTFTANLAVANGVHKVSVAFTNDYYKNGQDRNLYVDKLTIQSLP